MAFTAGFSVNVGDPTKASDVDVLAANDDYLKNAIDTFIANDANNRVLTATGSGTANGEANLTFDGSTLALTGAQTISSTLTATGATTIGAGQAVNAKALLTLTSTTSAGYGGEIQFHKNSASTAEIGHESAVLGSGTSSDLYLASDGNIDFATGGTTQRMTILSDGKTGIGASSPTTPFQVSPTAHDAGVPAVWLHSADNAADHDGTVISSVNNGSDAEVLHVRTNNTTYSNGTSLMLVRGDGRVGINNDSPTASLTVAGPNTATSLGSDNPLTIMDGNADDEFATMKFATSAGGMLAAIGAKATTTGVYPNTVGELHFAIQNGSGRFTAMVIDADRQIGIGTSSPDAPLHVESASVSDLIKVEGTGTDSNPNIQIANDARAYNLQVVGARNDAFEIWDRTAGITRLSISTGGNMGLAVAPSVSMHSNNSNYLELPNNVFRWSRSTGSYQSTNFYYNAASDAGVFAANGYGLMHSQNNYTGAFYWNITTASNTNGAGHGASLATKMYLDNTGLGVQTSSPNAPLAVASKTSTYEGMELVTPTGDASGKFQFGVHQSGSTAGRGIEFRRGGSDGFDTLSFAIDEHGNMGLGVATSAWRSTETAFQINSRAALYADSNLTTALANNLFINSSGYALIEADAASQYYQYQGAHHWQTVGSGSAGANVSPTTVMTLTSAGLLGINTASPTGTLELSSTATSTNLVMGGTPSSGTREPWRMEAEGDYLRIGQNKSSFAKYMTFLGSNVGIGTESPTYKLVVSNSGAAGYEFNVNGLNSGVNTVVYNRTTSAYVDSAHFALNHYVYTGSTPAERFRVESTGVCAFMTPNINIRFNGTATQSVLTNNDGVEIYTGGYIWAGRQAASLYLNRAGTTGDVAAFYYNSTTTVGSISVTSSATAYNTSSDYRLKENLVPITGAVDRVNALQPRRFNFISDPDTTVDGFVAHEVSSVVPEAITGEKDAVDEEGNPQYQGIDQSKLVPLLTAAIQELTARIEALEAA